MNNTESATRAAGVFGDVLVGIDGTAASSEALRQSIRLLEPDGHPRTLAVCDIHLAAGAGLAARRMIASLQAETTEAAEHARRELDAARVGNATVATAEGRPAAMLLACADQTRATLIALGSHGHSRKEGLLIGSTATNVVHRAPCSVLLTHTAVGLAPFPYEIVAGVDGSPHAEHAAAVAQRIAERRDAQLRIVTAEGGKPIDTQPLRAQWGTRLKRAPRHPVEALRHRATGADLLVVGSRGLHGLHALGRVSERITHEAPCSVLLVRADAPPHNRPDFPTICTDLERARAAERGVSPAGRRERTGLARWLR